MVPIKLLLEALSADLWKTSWGTPSQQGWPKVGPRTDVPGQGTLCAGLQGEMLVLTPTSWKPKLTDFCFLPMTKE